MAKDNRMLLASLLCIIVALCDHADALVPSWVVSRRTSMRVRTVQQGWPGDNFFFGGQDNEDKKSSVSIITPQMEEEVMASARASMDTKAVSRAVSSLIDDDRIDNSSKNNNSVVGLSTSPMKGSNKLRDLAAGKVDANNGLASSTNTISANGFTNNSSSSSSSSDTTTWNNQQIAIASGVTVLLLSPVVIPIIHVILPPIIPSPSSISFTGAALLGALAYIVALGDPTDQSNIAGNTSGALGESVEVGGAVSRIVGRTALETAKASAPRVKAVARAALDYDVTTATLEELKNRVDYLSQKTLELDDENQMLRYEVALFNAVEDVSGMYKLEELKELARYRGVRGYSSDSKNALLRRLVKESVLEIDLAPYYDNLNNRL